jgi:hypothetical protein
MENSAPIAANLAAMTAKPSSAGGQASVMPVSQPKGEGRPRGTAHKIDKEVARLAILAAWPSWAAQNLSGRAAKDNDAHVFLRSLRGEHPELFTFRCSVSPHEIAFSWLLKDGCIAY